MPGRVTRSLRTFHRDLDDLFAGFFGGDWPAMGASERTRTFWPRAEMSLKDGEHVLQLEVPGFKPEEVEVSLAMEPDKVKANLSHGILEVRMPASPKLVGKKIPIQVSSGEAQKQLKAA